MRGNILGIGVHVLCSDGKIREVVMNPRLAGKILEFVKHKQGGKIILGPHVLQISYASVAVSKEKEVDYIPLARQLIYRSIYECRRCGFLTYILRESCPNCQGVATLQL